MVIGVTFLIVCGFDIAYEVLWLSSDDSDDPELEGHPVKFNKTGALIPVVSSLFCTALKLHVCADVYARRNTFAYSLLRRMRLIVKMVQLLKDNCKLF